jgi:hypothetical protein
MLFKLHLSPSTFVGVVLLVWPLSKDESRLMWPHGAKASSLSNRGRAGPPGGAERGEVTQLTQPLILVFALLSSILDRRSIVCESLPLISSNFHLRELPRKRNIFDFPSCFSSDSPESCRKNDSLLQLSTFAVSLLFLAAFKFPQFPLC